MLREYLVPIIATSAIHIGLLIMVTWGWQQDQSKTPTIKPQVIEAKLVQMKQQTKKTPPPKQQLEKKQADQKKKAEAQKKKQQQILEKKRKAEAEKKRKAQELALKKKKELEKAKAKSEAEKRRQAEEERKRKEEERRRLEEEKKRKELEQEQRRKQELAQKQAAAEQAQVLAQQEQEMAMSYIGVIRKQVQYNWSRPPSARNGMSVELSVQLIPSGEVIAVHVKRSSGNNAFDRSAENAVKKVGRFPELAELYRQSPRVFERYFRRFNFVFTPDDLRR